MEKWTEEELTVRGKKCKLWREELWSAKKGELESETADKKGKEGERQKDATQIKALLIESNASREKSEKLQKRNMPTQEKAIQYLQKQLKELDSWW